MTQPQQPATTSQTAPNGANWKNVNNWHWVEKNCLPWARDYLTQRLEKLTFKDPSGKGSVWVEKVQKIEGDVDVNVRKGKVIYLFDLKIKMDWKGETMNGEKAEGEIDMPECTFDETPDTYTAEITCKDDDNADKRYLKDLVRKELRKFFDPIFIQFPKDLLRENAPSILVAGKTVQAKQTATISVEKAAEEAAKKKMDFGVPKPKDTVATVKVSLKSEFKCSAADLYECLMDEQRVSVWTGDKTTLKKEVNSAFSLMGGSVSGTIVSLEPSKKLSMKWRIKSWPEGHYSTVTMELKEGSNSTVLELTQTNVPRSDEDLMRQNWDNMYFNRIKHIFGYII